MNIMSNVHAEEAGTSRRSSGCGEEEDSNITELQSNSSQATIRKAMAMTIGRQTEKVLMYTHVRAGCGHATDRHSLAKKVE